MTYTLIPDTNFPNEVFWTTIFPDSPADQPDTVLMDLTTFNINEMNWDPTDPAYLFFSSLGYGPNYQLVSSNPNDEIPYIGKIPDELAQYKLAIKKTAWNWARDEAPQVFRRDVEFTQGVTMEVDSRDVVNARVKIPLLNKFHEEDDLARWPQVADAISAAMAKAVCLSEKRAQEIYDGLATIVYDYAQPQTIIGTNGLVALGAETGHTLTQNGAIVCTYNAILGAVKTVSINDTVVWASPLSVLGIGVPPSDPIPVSSGDVLTSSGVLGLGEGFNVTFYPNKTV